MALVPQKITADKDKALNGIMLVVAALLTILLDAEAQLSHRQKAQESYMHLATFSLETAFHFHYNLFNIESLLTMPSIVSQFPTAGISSWYGLG